MKTAFERSFARDLKKIKDTDVLRRIRTVIENIETINLSESVPNLSKLRGKGNYYRIRVGDYRLGIIIENETVSFIRCLHRREIYRFFP